MDTQTDFGFSGDSSPHRKLRDRRSGSNLFVALRPDAVSAESMRVIARDIRATYRIENQPLAADRLHISMLNLGYKETLNESTVYYARQAIDSIRFDPIELTFDTVVSFGGNGSLPIVLRSSQPNDPLLQLRLRLAYALDGLGLALFSDVAFEPHMTVLYHHTPIAPERLASPITVVVDQIWLIHSLVGQTKYEFLWPLRQ